MPFCFFHMIQRDDIASDVCMKRHIVSKIENRLTDGMTYCPIIQSRHNMSECGDSNVNLK